MGRNDRRVTHAPLPLSDVDRLNRTNKRFGTRIKTMDYLPEIEHRLKERWDTVVRVANALLAETTLAAERIRALLEQNDA